MMIMFNNTAINLNAVLLIYPKSARNNKWTIHFEMIHNVEIDCGSYENYNDAMKDILNFLNEVDKFS